MRSSIAQSTTSALHSKKLLGALSGVVALAVVGTTLGYASLSKSVSLTLDGETKTVSALGGTVSDVLADEGIKIGEHDVVAPALGREIKDGTAITVAFARPLDLTVDGKESTHWVTATSVGAALDQLGRRFEGADLSVSRSSDIRRSGLDLEVVTPKTVKVSVAGKKAKKHDVPAATVAEVLEQLDVDLGKDDEVTPAVDSEINDGTKIVVTRVEAFRDSVTDEVVEHGVTTKESAKLDQGTRKTVKEGEHGTRDVVYAVRKENGKVVSRKVVSSAVTKKPVDAVVKVGTKKPEVAEPNFAPGNSVWDSLAKCESGGNWSTNTGNGYYGGLQFSPTTWRSVGGTGLPSQHSREEQIKRGKILQSRAGWGQWPHCTSKLGLR